MASLKDIRENIDRLRDELRKLDGDLQSILWLIDKLVVDFESIEDTEKI